MSGSVFAGIDGGGTKTTIVLVDAQGAEVGRTSTSTSNAAVIGHDSAGTVLREGLESILLTTNGSLAGAWFGLSGSDRPEDHQRLLPHVSHLSPNIRFTNDAELVLAAFPDEAGLVVVAGTGSIAFGRGVDGERVRAGGWGQLLGDEGSGYDLAIRLLRAFTDQVDGKGPESSCFPDLTSELGLKQPFQLIHWVYAQGRTKAEIASLSHIVLTGADNGDQTAIKIVDDSARMLAATAHAAALRLNLPRPVPLALTGGLLTGSARFRDAFVSTLQLQLDFTLQIITDPALTAAQSLAARAALEPSESNS
jgi:N-acetylglucosamine kinase-like BadF-type ATPase